MMAFFYIFSSFLAVLYIYTGIRLIPSLFTKRTAFPAWICLFLFWAALALHVYFRVTDTHPELSRPLAWVGYSWLGMMSYLFCLVAGRDIIFVPVKAMIKIKQFIFPEPEKKSSNLPSRKRRHFLYQSTSFGISALSFSLTGLGAHFALQKPRVVSISIPLPENLKQLSCLTLAQFTDLHIGPTIGYGYVRQVCDILQDLNADIIAFTGDLVDGTPENLRNDLSPLKDLSARYGKFFITGNHEYYSGVERWLVEIENLGFTPLLNKHRVIEHNTAKLTLAGVTDSHSQRIFPFHQSSPSRALKGASKHSYKLLLAHQPSDVYKAADAGFHYQLSGHTHGGQYYPFQYGVKALHPFVKGLYRYKTTTVYVNQGTGYWGPPLRMGTFPEITLFTFV